MAAEGVEEGRRVQGRGGGGRGPGRRAAGGAVATVPVGGRAHGNPGPSALTLLESAGLLQIAVAGGGKPSETRAATIGHRITSSPVTGRLIGQARASELIFSSLSFVWVVKRINCARTAAGPARPSCAIPLPVSFQLPPSGLRPGNEELGRRLGRGSSRRDRFRSKAQAAGRDRAVDMG